MERSVNSETLKYLENKLVYERQYGFRQKRSTADLLTFVGHHWNRSLEFYCESQIIALDISKACDQVWNAVLLKKLPYYGISPKPLTEDFSVNAQTVCLDW